MEGFDEESMRTPESSRRSVLSFGTPGTFIGDSLVGYTDPSTMLYPSLCWYDAETGYRVVTKIKWERLRLSGNDHYKV